MNGRRSRVRLRRLAAGLVAASIAAYALADLVLQPPRVLSVTPVGGFNGNAAFKAKIVAPVYSAGGGAYEKPLIVVYGDTQGPDVWEWDGTVRPARDVFVTRSTDGGTTWSTPINVSGSAGLSSFSADNDGDALTPPAPYAGDTGNPQIINQGRNVLLSWVSRWCPGGAQRSVRYPDSGDVEVPYACLWTARSTDGGATFTARQLTDGSRDALQDTVRASSSGFAVFWQEDPRGLLPGEGDGPGEGGSGAQVNEGTDIWTTSLALGAFTGGTDFPAPRRITNNTTSVDPEGYETGTEGASRANAFLDGGLAVVAYEESKGLDAVDDSGKYVRYHTYSAFDGSVPDATAGAGCILSRPQYNARRVRLVQQPSQARSGNDLRLFVFWREGDVDHGGPADIVGRFGRVVAGDAASTGFRAEDLVPPVAAACTTRAGAFDNSPAPNFTSSLGLAADPEDDPLENAMAHRAVLRGSVVLFGYTWTPDQPAARLTATGNYDFYVRRSIDGGLAWQAPRNVSNLPDVTVTVREPRLVPTPYSPDPADRTNLAVYYLAWGTNVNQPEALGQGAALDIRYTRTIDGGDTFEPIGALSPAQTLVEDEEAQLRPSPDGGLMNIVWQQRTGDGAPIETMYATGVGPVDHLFRHGFED